MATIGETTRMAGLMSGLDTEELVKAMSANTKARLNSQKQKLQKLEWKQESYRGVIDKISSFRDKYLDILGENSIKANSVMKKCKVTSSNEKLVTATASAGASAGKYIISKATAATAASFSSGGAVSDGAVKLDFSEAEAGKRYTVEMNLDGVTKNITFTAGADLDATKASFLEAANKTFDGIMNSAQGFEFESGTATLKFNGAGDGTYHTFGVGASDAVGLDFNTSSKISAYSKLSSIDFNQELTAGADGKYKFNINGIDFEFTGDSTINDVVTKINDSDAGVKLTFSNASQSFEFAAKNTGATSELNISQSEGTLLNSLLNLDSSQLGVSNAEKKVIEYTEIQFDASAKITDGIVSRLAYGFDPDNAEESKYDVNISIGNKDYALELDLSALKKKGSDDEPYTDEEISAVISDAFKKSYMDVAGKELTGVEFSYADNKLNFNSVQKIVFGDNDFYIANGTTNSQQKIADETYIVGMATSELKFTLDGKEVTINPTDDGNLMIQDLIDAGLVTMDKAGAIIPTGTLSASNAAAESVLFSIYQKTSDIAGAKANDTLTAFGTNSTITVSSDGTNFMTYTSATNSFNFDGTNINLSDAGNFTAANADEYITIETEKDTSGIKDVIKNFVNDYNKLLDDIYGEVKTSRPKSGGAYYDPLTDEQEEEMSDKEIEKWEENAKKGLLYRDSSVQRFLSDIRGVMSSGINGMTLSAMGVSLTDNWSDNGKLKIDESKLESAIDTYGEQIADFFTGTDGLAARLEKTIDKAVSTKTNNYGYLTRLAGQANTKTDTDNDIFRQMKSIQDIIDRLTTKYEDEQERYWQRFSALETYMAKANQQASYFMQQ